MKEADTLTEREVNWDEYAKKYDALLGLIPYQQYIRTMVQSADIAAGETVLEIGCGTGNITQLLAAQTAAGRIVAIDNAPAMLARAQAKCADYKQVHFKELDLNRSITFQAASFDTVVAGNVIYAINDPVWLMREVFTLLKPGGLAVFSTPKAGFENGLILKAHCNDDRPDSCWQNGHQSAEREAELIKQAVSDPSLQIDLSELAFHNRMIAQHTPITLFRQPELETVLVEAGFTIRSSGLIYGDQNLLVVAQKGLR